MTAQSTAASTATLTWTTKRGANLRAEINYKATYVPSTPIDGGWEGHGKEGYFEDINVSLAINGKSHMTASLRGIHAVLPNFPAHSKYHDAGSTVLCDGYDTSGAPTRLAFDGISYDALIQAVETLRQSAASADVLRLIRAERQARLEQDMERARNILSIAKGGQVFGTRQDAVKWQRKWNNIHNEGGDGYVPPVVTQDEVAWAESVFDRDSAAAATS